MKLKNEIACGVGDETTYERYLATLRDSFLGCMLLNQQSHHMGPPNP